MNKVDHQAGCTGRAIKRKSILGEVWTCPNCGATTTSKRRTPGYLLNYQEPTAKEIESFLKDCQQERRENDPEYDNLFELHIKEIA